MSAPTVCPGSSSVAYYFWNISNAQQWLDGGARPAFQDIGPYSFQLQEFRYQVAFDEALDTVAYTFHYFQTWDPGASCAGCSLADMHVGVNRAYMAVLASGDGSEVPLACTLLPALIAGILQRLERLVVQTGVRASGAAAAAAQQWVASRFSAITALLSAPPGTAVTGAGYTLGAEQVARVRAYMARLLQVGALGGPALSPGAGGLLAARNVSDWLTGWADPLLSSALFGGVGATPAGRVALGIGWPSLDAPARALNKTVAELSPKDHPLIFAVNMSTGKRYQAQPTEVLSYHSAEVLPPRPRGQALGTFSGLQLGLRLRRTDVRRAFDATLGRSVPLSYAGRNLMGAWNETLTYRSPTIITLPHFYKADPAIALSTGSSFTADPELHDSLSGVEPSAGFTIQAAKGYQLNHLVRPSDVLHPAMWVPETSAGGMWAPSHWVRSTFVIDDATASSVLAILRLQQNVFILFVYALPGLGAVMALAVCSCLFGTQAARKARAELKVVRKSRAAPLRLTSQELADMKASQQRLSDSAWDTGEDFRMAAAWKRNA
ncbi:hypothetical protein WJX81_005203 [Elliptochloris bilobata]|uniref:Uncharacterized protein n=1 Tax=Elliptochloris bilobata TaxID=381761 RepID=A0AAW1RUJ1_9CHLO